MPVAVSGSRIEIVDADGRRYLDASGGAAVSCLGHGHPDVLAAMHEQLDALEVDRLPDAVLGRSFLTGGVGDPDAPAAGAAELRTPLIDGPSCRIAPLPSTAGVAAASAASTLLWVLWMGTT